MPMSYFFHELKKKNAIFLYKFLEFMCMLAFPSRAFPKCARISLDGETAHVKYYIICNPFYFHSHFRKSFPKVILEAEKMILHWRMSV